MHTYKYRNTYMHSYISPQLGLISSLGPDGSIASILPYENDSFWLRYGYTTLITTLGLIICLFGAKSFGRTSTLILGFVIISALLMFASFVPSRSLIITFSYNTTEYEYCVPPEDESSG